MPANILADMNSLGPGLEDQRALQIALELTKLGLNENDTSPPPSTTGQSAQYESEASMMRKSANMTECVPVPSSEHVAEIVGRQGCKIKALRAKTNTYIKTPVRGEEPVFVVTGRKEDVCSAKREILSAAEHFSQIRASRRNNNTATPGLGGPGQPAPSLPGQVTIQVRVPYRVVGLVVGPKGATIKRIQQQTHTYIVTPNRDKEPIFEVTGLPENVDKARQEIEGHIAMRTGGMVDTSLNNHINNVHSSNMPMGPPKPGLDECRSDFHTNGVDAGFHEISTNLLFSSMYNNKSPSLTSAFTPYNKASVAGPGLDHGEPATAPVFGFSAAHEAKLDGPQGPGEGGMSSGGLYDSDEGIGGSPTFESTTLPITSASIWSDLGSDSQGSDVSALFSSRGAGGIAPCLSMGGPMCLPGELPSAQRPDPLSLACTLALLTGSASVTSSAPPSGDSTVTTSSLSSAASSPAAPSPTGPRPTHCLVCQHADVTAALVPCGHNMFCMTCANKLVSEPDKHCPLCQQQPSQAIRIFS